MASPGVLQGPLNTDQPRRKKSASPENQAGSAARNKMLDEQDRQPKNKAPKPSWYNDGTKPPNWGSGGDAPTGKAARDKWDADHQY